VIGGAEAAHREDFAFQIGRPLDFRPGDELGWKKIEAAGNDRQVGLLQIGRDGRHAGGKKQLHVVGQQHLHAETARVERQVFDFEAVLLEQFLFVGGPQNGVNRRSKAAARRAHEIGGARRRSKQQTGR